MRDLLLTFDTETTSVNPKTCGVMQVAARAVSVSMFRSEPWFSLPQTVEFELNTFCRPGDLTCSAGAHAVHGISMEQVQDAPLDSGMMHVIAEFIMDNVDRIVVAGHNMLVFDWVILWRLAGLPVPNVPIIDTLTCATRTLPHAPDHKLSNLYKFLGLGTGEGAHDADIDVAMVEGLVKHFGHGLGMDWEELAHWCSIGRVLKTCHFGKFKGLPWGREKGCVPFWYARWIADNWDTLTPDLAMTLKKHYRIVKDA